MAKIFMDDNFLLETKTAQRLFNLARNEPVFDYHCHLIPSQIAQNKQMPDLAYAWLSGDHYKWRMMRAMSIDEKYITGGAPSYEKFLAWVHTVENLIGNPLYHWTHLELQRYFEIYDPLTKKNAKTIWEKANASLQTSQVSIKGIFEKFNIYAVGTTDDPIDSLEHHRTIAAGSSPIGKINTKVIPSFRPDRALDLNSADFRGYIDLLSAASGIKIKNTDDVLAALENRLDYFISAGCRSSDHSLEYPPYVIRNNKSIEKYFKNALAEKQVLKEDADAYKTKILAALSGLYAKKNIAMQLHFSSVRNINSETHLRLGPNTGYDAVNDCNISKNLAELLDLMNMEAEGIKLPKTVLYSLNPKDYYPMATIMGGFQEGKLNPPAGEKDDFYCVSKMQLGCAWWFCDHRDGMEEHMKILSNLGALPSFIGMLTDSRSFLSSPRHEYFRRIMCNLIGNWTENGEYPSDAEKLEKIVKDISFNNARRFFECG